MEHAITAEQIIGSIKNQLSTTWVDSAADTLNAGRAETAVTGIATSFTPSVDVLKKAVAAGKNMIITQQPAYYLQTEDYLKNDQTYQFKKDFIEKNNLVIWRLYDNWNARNTDAQLQGLARALGWDKYHNASYEKGNKFFKLPAISLSNLMEDIQHRLNIKGLRVIGDPQTRITKASISNGMFAISELQEILKDPEVNLIIIDEAIEWESCEYFRDILTWKGHDKAMILLGREAAEDPGYGEMATWLQTFITKVPIEWIPAGEPFWVP